MPATRRILVIVGGLAVAFGMLFAAQGSGVFPYPRSSFMVDQSPWIGRGTGLMAFGLLLILVSRRMRR